MKKNIYLVIVFVGVITCSAQAEQPIYFTDAQLKACVEEYLGVSDPTPTDMLSLIELNCSNRGIVDLTGFEYATNLTTLYLQNNQITDISVLSGLTNLKRLRLGHNQISDIGAIAGLTGLMYLSLGGNQISDISALWSLTDLIWLELADNQISDISALSSLVNLEHINLFRNQISDISALSGLTNLIHLNLADNSIGDISVVSGLTNLTRLVLAENQISDISALSPLTNLTELTLSNNQISDISVLSGLTNLAILDLSRTQVTDISALTQLTSLSWLNLLEIHTFSNNQVITQNYGLYGPLIIRNNPGVTILHDGCSESLTGDLNCDCCVDMQDLWMMAEEWLVGGTKLAGDLDEGGNIDFRDYAILTDKWLPQGKQWYVSPDGSPSGEGSFEDPWDLATALSNSQRVRPGDTVWLAGGSYKGSFYKPKYPSGTKDKPIVYRAMPGERVTLMVTPSESSPNVLRNVANYIWYWGLEMTMEGASELGIAGATIDQRDGLGCKYINIIVHDWPYTTGLHGPGMGGEAYGCLSYRNGHGFDTHNQPDLSWVKVTDCVAFDNYAAGFLSYAATAELGNILYQGGVSFGNGRLRGWTSGEARNFRCGGAERDDNFVLRECYTYFPPDPRTKATALFAYGMSENGRLTIEDNILVGGGNGTAIGGWEQVTFRNNTCYTAAGTLLEGGTLGGASQYEIDENVYYQGSGIFSEWDGANYQTFEAWQATTGWDFNSTCTIGEPNDVWIFVRPNKYEPDRSHLIIYNWPKTETVSVEMANLWPENGQQYKYRIVNVEDIWGEPAVEGTLSNGIIEVPMTGLYAPEFACYLVTRRIP